MWCHIFLSKNHICSHDFHIFIYLFFSLFTYCTYPERNRIGNHAKCLIINENSNFLALNKSLTSSVLFCYKVTVSIRSGSLSQVLKRELCDLTFEDFILFWIVSIYSEENEMYIMIII